MGATLRRTHQLISGSPTSSSFISRFICSKYHLRDRFCFPWCALGLASLVAGFSISPRAPAHNWPLRFRCPAASIDARGVPLPAPVEHSAPATPDVSLDALQFRLTGLAELFALLDASLDGSSTLARQEPAPERRRRSPGLRRRHGILQDLWTRRGKWPRVYSSETPIHRCH